MTPTALLIAVLVVLGGAAILNYIFEHDEKDI